MSHIMHFAYRISFEEGAILLSPWTGIILIRVNPGFCQTCCTLVRICISLFCEGRKNCPIPCLYNTSLRTGGRGRDLIYIWFSLFHFPQLDPFSPFVRQLKGAKRRYLVLFNSRASGGIFDLFQYAEKGKENCFSTVVFLHTQRMYSLRKVVYTV